MSVTLDSQRPPDEAVAHRAATAQPDGLQLSTATAPAFTRAEKVSTAGEEVSATAEEASTTGEAISATDAAAFVPGETASTSSAVGSASREGSQSLSSLPVGARLILRCRKDWRVAVVAAILPEAVILLVGSPSGRAYRLKRPPEAPLSFEGSIPLLCEENADGWRAAFARYDMRW